MNKEQLAFAVRLGREYPAKNPLQIADDVKRLFAFGRKVQQNAVNECNGVYKGQYPNGQPKMGWDDTDQAKADKVDESIRQRVEEMGYKVARLGGDPRGCYFQLTLPSGYVDGWGREGCLVPY